jgi:RNA-directed DNA polymerase
VIRVSLPKSEKVAVLLSLQMTLKLSSDDATLSAQFRALGTFKDIATLLEVTPGVLGFYLHRKDNYKVFELRKRSGGFRIISSPVTPLKIIQRKLNQVLQAVYVGRAPVHGFARGKSIVTNAGRHTGSGLILNFDLEDFFPSIHFGRVMGLFAGKPYLLPESVAITVAQICCYQGALPAGAPTSPTVANMICAQMDMQLKKLAIDSGAYYTRYADDITFSTRHDRFHPSIALRSTATRKWALGDGIVDIIRSNGFKIQERKTKVSRRGQRQEVTGLVVGSRLNVKRSVVRQARAMLHATEKWGVEAAARQFHARHDKKQRKGKADFLRVIRGKIEFIGFVRGRDDLIYLRLMERYLRLDKKAKMRPVFTSSRSSREVLEMAIWVLEEKGGPMQGTAFAAVGLELVTAAHVLAAQMLATCPALSVNEAKATPIVQHGDVDVARVSLEIRIPVYLRLGSANSLKTGDSVRVLGFPRYRKGATVNFQEGKISQCSPWHGVPQFVVDCPIVRGNSGGPVLNANNEVIGIAVKGQELPGKAGDEDELSRFVPIDFALKYLKA